MITVLTAAVIAVLAGFGYVSRLTSELRPVEWPDEAPLAIHENRARDQHLTHLVRLLAADDPRAAHRVVAELVDRLVEATYVDSPSGRATVEQLLGRRVARFLVDPPLRSPLQYRRELDAALSRIEEL